MSCRRSSSSFMSRRCCHEDRPKSLCSATPAQGNGTPGTPPGAEAPSASSSVVGAPSAPAFGAGAPSATVGGGTEVPEGGRGPLLLLCGAFCFVLAAAAVSLAS